MVDPAEVVAKRFELIGDRSKATGRPTDLSHNEKVIWYLVATRCEIDMEGFESVFDQLLTEMEVLFLIAALGELEEPELAASFTRAYNALKRVGFYEKPHSMCSEFGCELGGVLETIDQEIGSGNRMWSLDMKLAQLEIENG